MAETQFSITKLMSIIPKFKEAFLVSSLLWNQGARSLPVFVAVQLILVASKLNMFQSIGAFYSSLTKIKF